MRQQKKKKNCIFISIMIEVRRLGMQIVCYSTANIHEKEIVRTQICYCSNSEHIETLDHLTYLANIIQYTEKPNTIELNDEPRLYRGKKSKINKHKRNQLKGTEKYNFYPLMMRKDSCFIFFFFFFLSFHHLQQYIIQW